MWTDDAHAVREAVRYLAALRHRCIAHVGDREALGHQRIAHAGGPEALGHQRIARRRPRGTRAQRLRTDTFVDEARKAGIVEPIALAADFSGDAGAGATRTLLSSPQQPTAIGHDNDIMSLAGLAVAAEMRVLVPQDLSPPA